MVVPHTHIALGAGERHVHGQGRHAGGRHRHHAALDRRLHQHHAGDFALRDEFATCIHQHEGAVMLQACGQQARALHRNARAGLDREDPQLANLAGHVEEIGVYHGRTLV
ncbi:hypothetical protein D3C72_1141780 [compost metagenome]